MKAGTGVSCAGGEDWAAESLLPGVSMGGHELDTPIHRALVSPAHVHNATRERKYFLEPSHKFDPFLNTELMPRAA